MCTRKRLHSQGHYVGERASLLCWALTAVCPCLSLASTSQFVVHCFLCPSGHVLHFPSKCGQCPFLLIQIHNWTRNETMENLRARGLHSLLFLNESWWIWKEPLAGKSLNYIRRWKKIVQHLVSLARKKGTCGGGKLLEKHQLPRTIALKSRPGVE